MEDLDVDGRKILKYIFEKWDVGAWIESMWLRIRDRWRALVTAAINDRFPSIAEYFFTS